MYAFVCEPYQKNLFDSVNGFQVVAVLTIILLNISSLILLFHSHLPARSDFILWDQMCWSSDASVKRQIM